MKKLTLGVILVAAIYLGGIYFFPSTSTVYTNVTATSTPTEAEVVAKENALTIAKREAIEAEWALREGEAKEKAQKEYDRMMDEQRVASDKAALEALRKSLLPEIEALEKKQGF